MKRILLLIFFLLLSQSLLINNSTHIKEVFGQEKIEQPSFPTLNSIEINNDPTTLDEKKVVYVSYNDAVKISGEANPNDKIKVYLGDKEFDAVTDQFGVWFILFSFTETNQASFPVTAKIMNTDEEKVLLTLSTNEGEEDNSDSNNGTKADVKTDRNNKLITIFFILIFIIEITRLIVYILTKSKNFKKRK